MVTSLFLQNQPPDRRRLVQRLLRENRLFVMPSDDRIDVLSNYPFNQERLQQLIDLVKHQLDQRTGYAQVAALKAAVDRTDLGGTWLTPMLLADLRWIGADGTGDDVVASPRQLIAEGFLVEKNDRRQIVRAEGGAEPAAVAGHSLAPPV